MKKIRKPRYMYIITNRGKKHTFVTTRTIAQQKLWFEKVHGTKITIDDIKVSVIKESSNDNDIILS